MKQENWELETVTVTKVSITEGISPAMGTNKIVTSSIFSLKYGNMPSVLNEAKSYTMIQILHM
jgi:hypothetical protein